MAVVATCCALPVLVLILLHLPGVQGWDPCNLANDTCPDVCCGSYWNATCCFRHNSTDWWTTDYPSVRTFNMDIIIAILVGSSLAGLVGLIVIVCFCGLVCKTCCFRRRAPAFIITTSTGQGIPMVAPKEGYVFPGSQLPAASSQSRQVTQGSQVTQGKQVTQDKQTQGGKGQMSQSVV